MYSIKINDNGLAQLIHGIKDVKERLDSRTKVDPSIFAKAMLLRQEVHHKGSTVYEKAISQSIVFCSILYLFNFSSVRACGIRRKPIRWDVLLGKRR
jgi:hypothetical protein